MKRPTLTPASLVKKVFRQGERSLPRIEVIERLEESGLLAGQSGAGIVEQVLGLPDSPVRAGHNGAILELTHQPHQLFDLAYRYLRDTHTPRNTEQLLREIRRLTSLSWNQAARMLVLERDPRFVRYEGDARWFLAEWQVANDDLYEFVCSRGIDRLTLRTLPHLLEQEMGLNVKQTVVLPELDDRFRVEGETLYVLTAAEETDTDEESTDAAEERRGSERIAARAEAAAAAVEDVRQEQRVMKEEFMMSTIQTVQTSGKNDVLKEVEKLLTEALALLEGRQQEMSKEVVGHFQESNMQAIEELMKEKHQNEQVALGIQQVLTGLGRQ